jgi:hypothetical protein
MQKLTYPIFQRRCQQEKEERKTQGKKDRMMN